MFIAHGHVITNSLPTVVEAGGPVGGAGKRDTISALKSASDFPLVVTNVSTSKGTFFRSVAKEMKTILLFDIF
jgi:hypothetical protein